MDEEINNFKGNCIVGNDYNGGYKAAKYLYSLGHKKILIILGPEKLVSTQKRLSGFLKFFKEHEIEYDKNLITRGDFSIDSGYNCLNRAIRKKLSFTAIFALNDLMAIGAIQNLSENNIKIPDKVSVLGYDNIFIDQYFSPKITSIATPLDELAKKAVDEIIKNNVNSNKKIQRILIEPILFERKSCKKI